MVVSKRCKVCALLDAKNIPITGEYFGKLLPDLIVKISGVDLDPRKANGVLICQYCAVQMVQADLLINKLQNSLQRLKKLVKEKKPKTPSKYSTPAHTKKISDEKNTATNNDELQNSDKYETGEIDSQTSLDESKIQDETKQKTPKKIARRKSVFCDDKLVNDDDISKQNGEAPNAVTSGKFKKILDNEETPAKKTTAKATKRRPVASTNECSNYTTNSIQLDESNLIESTAMKRNKIMSLSVSEETPMDLTVDEQDEYEFSAKQNKVKTMNCVICGKVFHQKSALREHIETSHMGERLKACVHCSAEFRSQQKYDSHVFSEKCKNTNHPCQYPKCNKRFKTVHRMELHMQEKHSLQNESEAK